MEISKFAGRAGEKLEFALRKFGIDISGKICADFGSAVGGFVDCLLKHDALKVYAVEKGYGVLDWKLRNNPKVIVLERTNAMHVVLPEKVDLVTVDVSWTRQENIIPNALKQLNDTGVIISLIKPHYEAEKRLLKKGKLEEEQAEEVTLKTINKLKRFGVTSAGLEKSPILGGKAGNAEYLAYLKPQKK